MPIGLWPIPSFLLWYHFVDLKTNNWASIVIYGLKYPKWVSVIDVDKDYGAKHVAGIGSFYLSLVMSDDLFGSKNTEI